MSYFWDEENFQNDNIALLTEGGVDYSYRHLNDKIKSFQNINFNDQKSLVFIEASNDPDFIVAYLACLRQGNPVLLLDKALKDEFKNHLKETYQPNIYISFVNELSIKIEKFSNHNHEIDPGIALLLSTSGSTGAPKLVKLSKLNIQSNASSISEYLNMNSNDRAITLMPLHYSYGLSVLHSHLNSKASIILTDHSIISREIWDLIKTHGVTSISGVPFVFEMLQKLRFARMELPSLRYMTQAGGKLKTELVQLFSQICMDKDIPFYVMYGQTEASPRISYLNPDKASLKPESIGGAVPGGILYLKDEAGDRITQSNVSGEMIYEGDNVMLGYAEDLQGLKKSAPISELSTGDVAYFDDDGDFYIIGRMKRFIKLYGLRFSLDQIESHLSKLGYECVCGGDDDNLKIAVVDLKDDGKEIKTKIIADYKINIKSITIINIENIARTSSGKIDYKNIFK